MAGAILLTLCYLVAALSFAIVFRERGELSWRETIIGGLLWPIVLVALLVVAVKNRHEERRWI